MGVFDRLLFAEKRSSLENPATPLSDPDDWLYDAMGARESASGVRVSADSALAFAPWWRGVNLVSRDVAKLQLIVYRREGTGKERDPQHPAYRLLRHRANDDLMSSFTFKQTVQAHAMGQGNGYGWIRRRGNGEPMELIPLDASPSMTIAFRENGRLWYAVNVSGEWRRISPADILHIRGLSRDGHTGYVVHVKARESLGEGIAVQQYGARFFRNAAQPSVIIEVPGNMTDQAQREFLRQWDQMHSGLDASHRTAILTGGGKVHGFSSSAKESQLEEIRKFNLVDMANWIGVPVHKVGGEGRTAFASLEQENQAYLDESLDPWLVCWEEECREKLLTEEQKDRDTHVIEFMRQALVRADLVARGNYYQIALRGGWMSRDEVRSRENMNPLPDGEGEKFFAPLELQVVGEDETEEPAIDDLAIVLQITEAVTSGTIPPETAKAMLAAAFPLMSTADINRIIDPLEDFEPPKPDPPPAPPAPPGPSGMPMEPAPGEPPAEPPMEPEPDPADALTRQIVIDAARRACKHLRVHAVKRAKRAPNFIVAVDEAIPDDAERVSKIMDAVVRLAGGETVMVTHRIVFDAKDTLLAAADAAHSREELVSEVERRMTDLESTLPERVADLLMKGPTDGTPLPAE